jgi:CRP/FNR family cyclic AMP-dependent transcriptional regulator
MMNIVEQKVADFFGAYRLRKFAKGQVLVFSGEKPTSIYYLVAGRVKVYDVTNNGEEIILNVFKETAFFPMSRIILEEPSQFIFEAETDIEVRVAPGVDVLPFVQANNDVLFDLMCRVYSGVDGIMGRAAHLMAGTARDRLIYELLIEAKRFGKETAVGYELSLFEKDLGARAGLSRETVSREMHKLKTAGLVSVHNKVLSVPSIDKLKELLVKD